MKETEIRPDALMDGARMAMLTDLGRMLLRRREFVDVNCPACGRRERELVHRKYGLEYQSCQFCDTIYISPRPTPEILAGFYSDSVNYAYWNKHIYPASEDVRRERIVVPRVERVLQYCKAFGVNMRSILEIGSGFGTFLDEMKARKAFTYVEGVELSASSVAYCRERGLTVFECQFEDMSFEGDARPNVIVSFEVIEHLFSPSVFVENCAAALTDDGLLFLTCPNGRGFDFVVLGQQCGNMDHEHLNYFNPMSLEHLLDKSGFDVLDVQTPGKLDAELVRKQVLAGEYSLREQPFLRQVLVERWDECGDAFQEFLSTNLLSSNLMVVARKRAG